MKKAKKETIGVVSDSFLFIYFYFKKLYNIIGDFMDIQKRLFELQDKEYAKFTAKLTPNVNPDLFIGVRVPQLRKLAKEIIKAGEYTDFLNTLPHHYYDENLLHSIMISLLKDYDQCIDEIERFLPYIDNWAVCDLLSPKVFKKYHTQLFPHILDWANSKETYTCRFGVGMLMEHFLNEDFKAEYLQIPANIISDEYYVNMMLAWYFATALAKQYDSTLPLIESKTLPKWVQNKTIQKAKESFRVADDHKAYLNTLKI